MDNNEKNGLKIEQSAASNAAENGKDLTAGKKELLHENNDTYVQKCDTTTQNNDTATQKSDAAVRQKDATAQQNDVATQQVTGVGSQNKPTCQNKKSAREILLEQKRKKALRETAAFKQKYFEYYDDIKTSVKGSSRHDSREDW